MAVQKEQSGDYLSDIESIEPLIGIRQNWNNPTKKEKKFTMHQSKRLCGEFEPVFGSYSSMT